MFFLIQSIRTQMSIMMGRKTAIITFYIMLLFVLCNYISNVLMYRGYDIAEMYQPVKLLLLSEENVNTPYGFYLMQIFPILVVFPVGFSFALDKQSNTMLFLCSRIGNRAYFAGKIVAVFLSAFIIFSVPLFLEMGLNYLSFPKEAMGYLSNQDIYSENYLNVVRSYPFYQLYVFHPYIYVIIWICIFGSVAGMLSVFTVAVSTFPITYKILLFLPVYLLLNGIYWIGDLVFGSGQSMSYFFFLRIFVPHHSKYAIFYGIIILLFFVSVVIIMKRSQKDYFGERFT